MQPRGRIESLEGIGLQPFATVLLAQLISGCSWKGKTLSTHRVTIRHRQFTLPPLFQFFIPLYGAHVISPG